MSHVHDRSIAEAESKLVALISEAKGVPGLFPRVEAWVARMCGARKLSEYLHDEAIPSRERVTVAKSLVEILLTKEHDRLPSVSPGGAHPPEPSAASSDFPAGVQAPDAPASEDPAPPAPDELRSIVRREIRHQLSDTLETIARVLRETA